MPKTVYTPRDELICGKIDAAIVLAKGHGDVALIYLLERIAHDAERMEQKLISRKQEAENTECDARILDDSECFAKPMQPLEKRNNL